MASRFRNRGFKNNWEIPVTSWWSVSQGS